MVTVVVSLVGVALSIAAAFAVRAAEQSRARSDLEGIAQNTAAAIQSSLDVHLEVVQSVVALFRTSESVSREDFQAFTGPTIRRHRGIQALEWAPQISRDRRDEVEKAVQSRGYESFRFTERDDQGRLVAAGEHDRYYPVLYVEPMEGNESALGYADMSPARRRAIERARDEGRPITSGRLRLIQEQGDQFGFLVFMPVYQGSEAVPATVGERRRRLSGFVEGVFRVDDFIREGVRRLDLRKINFAIVEDSGSDHQRPLFIHRLGSGEGDVARLGDDDEDVVAALQRGAQYQTTTLYVPGGTWTLLVWPAEGFPVNGGWTPWLALAIGLVFAFLLTAYVGSYQSRAAKIERLVERRTAEVTKANERLEMARLVIDRAVEAVIRIDTAGRVVGVNEAACDLYGYERRELLSLTIGRLAPRWSGDSWDEHWSSLRRRRALSFEASHLDKEEKKIPVEVTATYLKFGDRVYACWFVRDISERRQAENALRRSEEQLRQSQKMEAVGLLAGGVAHDFNNLLSGILGFAEIGLMKIEVDHPVRRYLTEIMKAGNRAASLTRQLLAFSRRQVLEPEVLSINDVVADMGKMIGRLIGEDISLKLDLAEGLRPVYADPGQIEQVILNLCINARDAMPNGGELLIETRAVTLGDGPDEVDPAGLALVSSEGTLSPGPYLRLVVRDTGAGMSEEVQAHIFEPFFTTKSVGRGTGLGLATVYGIVTQSEGGIAVESSPDQGTRFDIFLPCVTAAAHLPKMYPEEAEMVSFTPTKHRHTILLVEDEETVRELCYDVLQGHGYEVLQASSGEEALELLAGRREGVDLLLTDVVMTGMTGIELARAVTSRQRRTPVIVMTGYNERQVEARDIVGARLLLKPFSPAALIVEVKEALQTRLISSAPARSSGPRFKA